jgi:NAD(P)-dependent dehydrogenase (short-subunit alcohol dehydrogenase family)
MRDLQNKTAVVTGAGSGIGRSVALALAREGVHLALLDVDQRTLPGVCDEVAALGVRAHAFPLDVSDRAAVLAVAAQVGQTCGDIHILCSNAGVAYRGTGIEDSPDEIFDWLFNVNVFGMFNVCKAFVAAIKRHGAGGHVVLTGSISGLHLMEGRRNGVYTATKMAVVGLAEAMRETLEPQGIGVSVLCPGNVATNAQHSGRWRPERFGGAFERAEAAVPRPGMDPDDVGRVVVRAIADGEFYVFPHPTDRPLFQRRVQGMLDAFDRWEQILPTLGIDPKTPAV